MRNALIMALLFAVTAGAEPKMVTLCKSGNGPSYLPSAEKSAAELFRSIGVKLGWIDEKHCPSDAIHIRFDRNLPASDHPGALAYAHPYEAKAITVFTDRVDRINDDRLFTAKLLAHVLAHEITHVLQGVARHSNSGIMKESWNSRDYSEMAWNGLSFEPTDVTLIENGLRRMPKSPNIAGQG